MHHKFIVGQVVDIIPAARISNHPGGPYTILSTLPLEGDTPRYRVQSAAEKVQRVVGERDLRPSMTALDIQSTSEPQADRITIGRR